MEWTTGQAIGRHPGEPAATVHALFEAQATRTPSAVAVAVGTDRLTYRRLNGYANRLAHYLRYHDVGPRATVGICAEPSLGLPIALLGVLKAGGACLLLDPVQPREWLAAAVSAADPVILLTQARLAAALPATDLTVVRLDADWAIVADEPCANPAPLAGPDDLAWVSYRTAGPAGRDDPGRLPTRASAVVASHREVVARSRAADRGLSPAARGTSGHQAWPGLATCVEELVGAWIRGEAAALPARSAR